MKIVLLKPIKGLAKNLAVEVIEGEPSKELIQSFEDKGWEYDVSTIHSTGEILNQYFYPPKGTNIFGIHTTGEKSKYIRQFKDILSKQGIAEYLEKKVDFRDFM